MKNAKTPTQILLISNGGEIQCDQRGHSPFPRSDTWHRDGWRQMTTNEKIDFEAEVGRAPACETCAAIARKAGGA